MKRRQHADVFVMGVNRARDFLRGRLQQSAKGVACNRRADDAQWPAMVSASHAANAEGF